MLAGGIVEPGAGRSGSVSAYVALSAGRGSRLFKVYGPVPSPQIAELPPATTVDLSRFEEELRADLQPFVDAAGSATGVAGIARPSSAWVCEIVRAFLETPGNEPAR